MEIVRVSFQMLFVNLILNDISSNNITTKLYPNPTNNKSKLEVDGLKSDADIIVSDLLGRVIKSYKINPTNNELEIDVSSFDKGIYNIRIMNDSINQTYCSIIYHNNKNVWDNISVVRYL